MFHYEQDILSPTYLKLGMMLELVSLNDTRKWMKLDSYSANSMSSSENCGFEIGEMDFYQLATILDQHPDVGSEITAIRKLLASVDDELLKDYDFCRKLVQGLFAVMLDFEELVPPDLALINRLFDEFIFAEQNVSNKTVQECAEEFREFAASYRLPQN